MQSTKSHIQPLDLLYTAISLKIHLKHTILNMIKIFKVHVFVIKATHQYFSLIRRTISGSLTGEQVPGHWKESFFPLTPKVANPFIYR